MLSLMAIYRGRAGRWAMVLGFGAYFLVPVYDDEKFGILFGQSLLGYLTESKLEKLRRAIYPNVAASTVLKIIGIFDDFESAYLGRGELAVRVLVGIGALGLKACFLFARKCPTAFL